MDPDTAPPEGESPADAFLRLACLTYEDDRPGRRRAAAEHFAAHPGLAASDLFVAAACADVAALHRHLAGRGPNGAAVTGGPYGWSPLLYLAYARHDPDIDGAATVQAARLLLAAGADPDDRRLWHSEFTFTALTGILGGGEQDQPRHPHALPLARVLLEAGADPNDGQALYNRMCSSDDDHLVLLFEFGLGTGIGGPWHRRLGDQLESPSEMLRSLLAWAVVHDQRERVALLAAHGVDIVSPFDDGRAPRRGTPAEVALSNGHRELAEQLVALGAPPPRLRPGDSFVAAVLAGDADADAVAATPDRVVATVRQRRTGLVTWAAAQGALGSVGLLVAAGFDIDALGRSDVPGNAPWHTALHAAVEKDDAALAAELLGMGADPDVCDGRFGGTPLDWARHFDRPALVELLAPVTRPDPA